MRRLAKSRSCPAGKSLALCSILNASCHIILLTLLSSQRAQVGAQDLRACDEHCMHYTNLVSVHASMLCTSVQSWSITHLQGQRQPAAACNHVRQQHRCIPDRCARCKGPSLEQLHVTPLRQQLHFGLTVVQRAAKTSLLRDVMITRLSECSSHGGSRSVEKYWIVYIINNHQHLARLLATQVV